jgi:LacI family transcriptional regulator
MLQFSALIPRNLARGSIMVLKKKKVLLALGWYAPLVHRGIEEYASEHAWHLSPIYAREKVVPWGWEGDGILAWLGSGDELAQFVTQARKPTVDFSWHRPQLRFPRVLMDYAAGSKLVAEHFLTRGFRHFLYYSDRDNWGLEERGKGFIAALEEAGYRCDWLRWHKTPYFDSQRDQWTRKRQWLQAYLKKAPTPLAVFAGNDELALEILEACETAGLAVPESIAIVGADNLLLAPDSMSTPISTVDPNHELMGYTGAKLLDKLMKGRAAPAKPIRIPPGELIVRRSSDLLAINHKGLSNSLRYMMEHCHEPITVEDVVAVAAMSRRGLHKAFLQHLGRTPGNQLLSIRMERAKRLLLESPHKVEVIANMCGFTSPNGFSVAFKHATRLSPSEFRESLSASSPPQPRRRF